MYEKIYMRPDITSALAFILLAIGTVAAIHIVILLGTNTTRQRYLRWGHRISGYLFFAFYLFICFIMFRKFSRDSVTLPAKDAIHVYIGIVIFPLLVAKICIARFFKKFYKSLSLYGMLSLISVYLVTSISAGYYVSYTINSQYVVLAENGKSVKVSVNLGRKVIQQKCSACHSLERVFAYAKTKDDWQNYILRMRAKDPAILTDREATQVLGYLIKNLGINETTLDIQLGIKIILEKCHKCHTIERIFTARKTAEEWTQTIELMRSFDPYLLNDREARQINNYAAKILSRQKSE